MTANVFISFASQDRKVATTLCAALESRGFSCWIATRDILPGENFQIAIVRAIRHAKMMLLVFTGNSNASDEMSKELALASQQKLIVVPLRIEDVAPNEAFAYEFATRQWIDFFADWEVAINQLCERLASAMPPEPKAAPEPPPIASPIVAEPVIAAPPVAPAPVAEAAPPSPKVAAPAAKAPEAKAPESKTKAAPEPKPAFHAKPAVTPPARPGASGAAVDAEPARKSRVGLYAGIAVAVLLVIGVGVALPVLNGKKTDAQASVSASSMPRAAAHVATATAPPAALSAAPAASSAAAQSQAAQLVAANAPSPSADGGAAADAPSAPAPSKPRPHKVVHAARAAAKTDVPY